MEQKQMKEFMTVRLTRRFGKRDRKDTDHVGTDIFQPGSTMLR